MAFFPTLFCILAILGLLSLFFWMLWNHPVNTPHSLEQKLNTSSHVRCQYLYERLNNQEEWREAVLVFDSSAGEILLYPPSAQTENDFILKINPKELRGLWQVDYRGNVWLDIEKDKAWRILKLIIPLSAMGTFKTNIRLFANQEQIKAYEANPHSNPPHVIGSAAQQQITGEWDMLETRTLYLSPAYLVLLTGWANVHQIISTLAIQDIEAIPRMDEERTGILRFSADGKQYSFAIPDYEEWATALAQAAAKAQGTELDLEIMELKKKKDEEG